MRIFSILLLLACLSGCTFHQRNELRFIFTPWDWVPPTPTILTDSQAPGWDVQISIRNDQAGIVEDSNGAAAAGEVTLKAYAWGKRQGNDLITSADLVREVKWSSSTAVRQLKNVTRGQVVWSGFIRKPYKVEGGLAYWRVTK
jgi:hypothetical protein